MKVGLVGDIHGQIQSMRLCLVDIQNADPSAQHIFQLGDFGLYPDADEFYDNVEHILETLDMMLYVTPGNHEDWDYINALPIGPDHRYEKPLRDRIIVVDRGWSKGIDGVRFVSLGGAPSVDRTYRQQHGWPWSTGEVITQEDLTYLPRAHVMLAHDAPWGSTEITRRISHNPHGFAQRDLEYANEGRIVMTKAVNIVQPKVFFHGHYHFPVDEEISFPFGKVRQIGLAADAGPFSSGVLDTETLGYEGINRYWNS